MRGRRSGLIQRGDLLALALAVGAGMGAITPVGAQSPSPGTVGAPPDAGPSEATDTSPAPDASPSPVPGGVTPLPARITGGTCDEPSADDAVDLQGPIAGGSEDDQPARPVYLSVSTLDTSLDDLTDGDRILVVGGDPGSPESAIVCGTLAGPRQSPTDLAVVLDDLNRSGYQGTALLREAVGAVTVLVVVVSPAQDEAPPSPAASPEGSPVPTAPSASVAPPPSVQPGTSGAPPFSPLPQATSPA